MKFCPDVFCGTYILSAPVFRSQNQKRAICHHWYEGEKRGNYKKKSIPNEWNDIYDTTTTLVVWYWFLSQKMSCHNRDTPTLAANARWADGGQDYSVLFIRFCHPLDVENGRLFFGNRHLDAQRYDQSLNQWQEQTRRECRKRRRKVN